MYKTKVQLCEAAARLEWKSFFVAGKLKIKNPENCLSGFDLYELEIYSQRIIPLSLLNSKTPLLIS